jgi:S1-C subfamily serine protease
LTAKQSGPAARALAPGLIQIKQHGIEAACNNRFSSAMYQNDLLSGYLGE